MASFSSSATLDVEQQQHQLEADEFDYSKRSQWLRAAVLGANDGLVSTASLMMGIGAVKQDIKSMILTGFAGLVAGAGSMAIGEFVSVYSQLEIELAQLKRISHSKRKTRTLHDDQSSSTHDAAAQQQADEEEEEEGEEVEYEKQAGLPNPVQAAAASAMAFSVGAMVPLLAASFIRDYKIRIGAVVVAVTFALMVFGWVGAYLGKAPVVRSALRVLLGGWLAMSITYGLTKLIGSSGF
uniref:Vacuolar iron transporter n=1 Tax=Kalanchoe fedtschenkoi TaxID=63787 RepID=A0A7N0TT17_KALFE